LTSYFGDDFTEDEKHKQMYVETAVAYRLMALDWFIPDLNPYEDKHDEAVRLQADAEYNAWLNRNNAEVAQGEQQRIIDLLEQKVKYMHEAIELFPDMIERNQLIRSAASAYQQAVREIKGEK
jgi:hypothetical protein